MVYRWPLNRYKNGISKQKPKNLGRTFDFSEYLADETLQGPLSWLYFLDSWLYLSNDLDFDF